MEIPEEKPRELKILRAELLTCIEKYFVEDDASYIDEAILKLNELKDYYYPLSRG